jgi:hemerythrin superfamily protein
VDAVTLLKTDHHTVEALFRRYEALEDTSSYGERRDIVNEVIRELSIHASIEELVLYPSVREALPEGDSLADEALEEHREVKSVLADLDAIDPSDPQYDAEFRGLIRDVRHHVEEEEREMFPMLASVIPEEELMEMGRKMEDAKGRAPTRPHPHAPAKPPANIVTGPVMGAVDRMRDMASGRTEQRKSTRRPSPKASKKTTASRPRPKPSAKRAPSKTSTKATARRTGTRGKRASGPVIHVTPEPKGGWKAGIRGARAIARGTVKQEVVRRAREVAKRRAGRLVIHKQDGRIQEERTYGGDTRRGRG